MRRDRSAPSGTLHRLKLDCRALRGNFLNEETLRAIDVYAPHGCEGRELALLVDLVGFTAGGPAHTNWKNFGENVPERLDRLIASGAMAPCVVAFPDCYTKLGGNQYINSSVMGPWADVIRTEIVPYVEQQFGCGGRGRRGVFGKSSGGYGAITHALLYPDFWAAAACHSGDMAFELCYLPEFPRLLRTLGKKNFDIKAWIDAFHASPKLNNNDLHDLMTLAMCASYDPAPEEPSGIRLPVTTDTCELIAERWANFLKWDPLELVKTHAAGLAQLKALYIDCGSVDQYNLVYGARRLHRALIAAGTAHTYEEFADDHSSVDYRMDVSLPLLAQALNR
ncbi:MAG: enterochelin esterase [Alphaproteobacteria bacterium]|nr:enterochelin esterase [Alphaproteobacteria bacterium]